MAFAGYGLAWVAGQLLAAVVVTSSGDDSDTLPIGVVFAAVACTWAAYGALLWFASQRDGTGDPVADYAVSFRWPDLAGVPIGVVTQLALVPLLYWPLRTIWPDVFSVDEVSEYAEDLLDRASGLGVALLVVMVVLLAPLVEELVYRGLLQRSLASRLPAAAAAVGGAAFFALIHFRPIEYPGLFLVGIVLGACVATTGRLGTAIAAHVAFNATGLLLVAG